MKKSLSFLFVFFAINVCLIAQNALNFGGNQNYVTVPFFATPENLTVEAWIKTTQTGTGTIISWKNVASNADAELFRIDNGYLQYGEWRNNISSWKTVNSSVKVNVGLWTHVAVVRNGNQAECYVNGVLSATGLLHANSLCTTDRLLFGAISTNWNESFVGNIDDIRIWNVARTASEIYDNFNKELNGNEAGLVGYWNLNGDANDKTANSRNGVVTGAGFITSDQSDKDNNGWKAINVGTVSVGNTNFQNSSIVINSSGYDIEGTSDAFHFAYKTIEGDFDVKTKITSQTNTNSWAKAGIMLREGLNTDSKMVVVELTPGNSAILQSRFVIGSKTYAVKALELTSAAKAPYWLRLVRKDSVVAAYCSTNGTNWVKVGYSSVRYKFNRSLNVGLVVSSHASSTCTTVFENTTFGVPVANDTIDNLGLYYSKKSYTSSYVPVFAADSARLPDPIIDGNPGWRNMYYKAWKLAFSHILTPPPGSPLVSNWYDAAFNDNIFQWDMIFMSLFGRYANHIFPGIQSMDNFYCMQDKDGFIPRELSRYTGNTWVSKSSPEIINPPLFSWAEVQSYQLTGDKSRFAAVLPALEKYFEWLDQNRKCHGTPHLLYWNNGLGSGMDNTPRAYSPTIAWADMSCQMVLQCKNMATICDELGLTQKADYYRQKATSISANINRYMWNETDGLYYDVDANGNQLKVKTLGCFWAMLAGVSSETQNARLIANLKDTRTFWRPMIFPTLAADDSHYYANGKYWLGGVWAPTNYAVINGLTEVPDNDFAKTAAEKYIAGLYDVFLQTGTLWENYAPELINGKLKQGTNGNGTQDCVSDFVGWTGLGPISMLIENVLGFRLDGASKHLVYDLRRLDRHGIRNLRINDITTTIITDARNNINSSVNIRVISDKPYNLEIWRNGEIHNYSITAGENNIVLGITTDSQVLKNENSVQLYYSPANKTVSFNANFPANKSAEINCFDMNGRQMMRKTYITFKNGKFTDFVNVSAFSKGVYIFEVKSGSSVYKSKLIL